MFVNGILKAILTALSFSFFEFEFLVEPFQLFIQFIQ